MENCLVVKIIYKLASYYCLWPLQYIRIPGSTNALRPENMFGDKFSPWRMVVYIRIVANSMLNKNT